MPWQVGIADIIMEMVAGFPTTMKPAKYSRVRDFFQNATLGLLFCKKLKK
jgi:hypothetical protein